jgi:hypothetical protein
MPGLVSRSRLGCWDGDEPRLVSQVGAQSCWREPIPQLELLAKESPQLSLLMRAIHPDAGYPIIPTQHSRLKHGPKGSRRIDGRSIPSHRQ